MADATAREQLILEMINRARMDPEGEAARYGISLNQGLTAGTISSTPKQVLAFNPQLNDAADAHSNWMLNTDTFSHTGVNGSSPGQRMTSAGYQFTGSWTWGENIAWSGSTGSFSGDANAATHHKNLFLSAGHRTNILNDNFREVGIGSITGSFKSGTTTYNALMTTENFAKSGSNIFVTGVTYNDTDNDDFYSIGEGLGSRTVTLLQNGSSVATTTSAAAGGFSLGTTVTGPVEVRFSGGGLAATMGVSVSLAGKNVKVDLVDGNTIQSNVTAQLTQSSANLTLLGIENVNGTGNDLANTITGNKGNNTLTGEGGNDTLIGGAGVDTYLGGSGDDIIRAESNDNLAQSFGGEGFDKLYITGSAPSGLDYAANGFEELWVNGVLVGSTSSPPPPPPPPPPSPPPPSPPPPPPPSPTEATEGNDVLAGTSGNDTINALGGNDHIDGAAGADIMIGGTGNDTYVVDNSGDVVNETNGSGVDTVLSSVTFSLASTTTTKGNVENLTLTGTAAINATGNSLANTIVGNAGNNIMSGGTGVDTVSYETATSGVRVNLGSTSTQSTGGAGNDRLSGFENLTGSAQSDTLTGSSGNNVIRGLGGNDTINGGLGNDVLIGGGGNDLLIGGSSSDRFVFTSLTDGSDVITDFVSKSDKLDLTELTASVGLGDASFATLVANGNILVATGNFATGTSTNGSSTDTRVYFDADGTAGPGEAILVATLEDVKILSTDFLV